MTADLKYRLSAVIYIIIKMVLYCTELAVIAKRRFPDRSTA